MTFSSNFKNHEYEFKNDDEVVLSFLAGELFAAGSKADLFEFPAFSAKDLNPELAAEDVAAALVLLSPLLLLFKFIFSKILLVFAR